MKTNNNMIKAIKFLILNIILITNVLGGCWIHIPLEKTIYDSHLIIHGKIIKIEDDKNSVHHSIAYIEPTEILKNKQGKALKPGALVKLRMATKIHESTDLVYKLHQKGIWILHKRGEVYTAGYPTNFQPTNNRNKIREILLNQTTSPETITFSKHLKADTHVNQFTKDNPNFKEKTGSHYELSHLVKAAQQLFKSAAIEHKHRPQILEIMRSYIYSYLDLQARNNGEIEYIDFADLNWIIDQRVKKILPDSKYMNYLKWKEASDPKKNDMNFLFKFQHK